MTGVVEKMYPLGFGVAGFASVLFFRGHVDVSANVRSDILQSITAISSILAGFLGTSLSIVVSFFDRDIFRRLQHNDLDKRLIDFIVVSISSLVAVSILAVILLFFGHTDSPLCVFITALLGFFCAHSLASLYRVRGPVRGIVEDVRRNQ